MALRPVGLVDRGCRYLHCMSKVALRGCAIFGLRLDRFGIERSVVVLAVAYREVLGRIARLLKGFGDHQRDRLSKIAHLARGLFRRLSGSSLRRSCDQGGIVDHRHNARHRKHGIRVDSRDFSLGNRRGNDHSFEAIVQLVFRSIGRGAGDLEQTLDPRGIGAKHALPHVVEAIGVIRFVLLEIDAHSSAPVASASTAARVRRASGILKSFSP